MTRMSRNPPCSDCPIRHNAVCADCDAAELAVLERAKSYRSYPPGASLARAGAPLDHVCSVVSGAASLSRTLEDGRRQVVGLLLPSDFIGRPQRAVSVFDIEALSEVTLCRFERRAFDRLVRDTPHIATRLLTMTLDELDAARDWAVVLGRLTAREKVASLLVSLARRQDRAAGTPRADGTDETDGATILRLPLSREAMADHLGLTIETTSRQITALRRDGLIELPAIREVRIPDLARLARVGGLDGHCDALP